MTVELAGAVVVVTGASSGIGAATARAVSAAGAHPVLVARRVELLRKLAGELPAATVVAEDLRDPGAAGRVIDAALAVSGRLEALVNNAGMLVMGPVVECRDVSELFAVNVFTPVELMRRALEVMVPQGTGAIVTVSTGELALERPHPEHGAYVASKAALTAFTDAAREELRGVSGVSVSTVYPGATDTPMWARARGNPNTPDIPADPVERVADAIVGLITGGDAEFRCW